MIHNWILKTQCLLDGVDSGTDQPIYHSNNITSAHWKKSAQLAAQCSLSLALPKLHSDASSKGQWAQDHIHSGFILANGKPYSKILFFILGCPTGKFQTPNKQDSNLYPVNPQPTTPLTDSINHTSQASLSMGRFRTKIQSWFLPANKSSHTKRCEEVVLTNMKSSYDCVEFSPYSFETLGLPASGQRSLLVACSQDMVPAELRKVFLSFQQTIAKAATLKMVHCLAKHSSDTVKYEMEMMRRGSSKRTVEDANLAQQDADRSDDMPCKRKKKSLKECLEEAFHHRWLPTQEYEIPDPYAKQLKGLHKQNQVIHVHACVLAHRAANIKSNVLLVTDAGSASSKAARLQEDTLPKMKQNSEILCLSRAGNLRLLMPTDILCL